MRADDPAQQTQLTLTEYLRIRFKHVVDPIGAFLNHLGIAPNTLTFTGLIGNLIGAMFLSQGNFLVGGLIVLAMGPLDALDGTMARLRGEASDFGAFVDSVTDRYIELIIYGGLLVHYLQQAELVWAWLIFGAAAGSVLVSYVKARAEALNFEAKGGILTRAERYIVLAPSLVFGIPKVGIAIVAILANITAFQRIYFVRRQVYKQ
ncbi:MAG: CDP-alcohol phosphatidyltransferase family protein [Anaerolineaceae bacterium]|nr:MAG: CDP-alcohol phosphatidyltransferase family protein [Anaerolineaceae bacterium]